jgi:hypothetical protein
MSLYGAPVHPPFMDAFADEHCLFAVLFRIDHDAQHRDDADWPII